MKRSCRLGHGTCLLATASLSLLLGAGAALAQRNPRNGSALPLVPSRAARRAPRAEEVARAQRELDHLSELHRQGRASVGELLEA